MNESILRALMQLFAIVIDIDKSGKLDKRERSFVESFLAGFLNKDLIQKYLQLFDRYLKEFGEDQSDTSDRKKKKKVMLDAMKILSICEQINSELEQSQKTFVLLKLLEFISLEEQVSEKELDFVLSVASAFNIDETEYLNCKNFVFNVIESIPDKTKVLFINSDKESKYETLHKYIENSSGDIIFLYVKSTNTLAFRYLGSHELYLNGQILTPRQIYVFNTGSSLRSATINTIYYIDIVKEFLEYSDDSQSSLQVKDLEFTFKNSENGSRVKNLEIDSGQLVGIMGSSGSGKSTLLNILNGNIKPQKGKVFINGRDIYDENRKEKSSLIGYVPQDDILFEELTVYQNLYLNSRLSLDNLSEDERVELVNNTLYDLDLYEIKDLVVGNLLNKFISGGQRKRLNIALELIREPSVLFVDEPTSGLSSVDSEMVMNLLKELTLKGKIVIVNIHQPSSDIFKMFDRMLFLDKGGYLIYSGNPIDAIKYFKTKGNYINAEGVQCIECGNVNPEQVLQIIESKIVNEYGKLTRTRKISPKEWFDLFNETQAKNAETAEMHEKARRSTLSTPNKAKQFSIFFYRDWLAKLTNKQYLLIVLLEAPVLAILLGYFTKYIGANGNGYVFSDNSNIPAFIFMAVVVALFLGLSISAEEIIKDQKHLKRESFLGLSKSSYLHSKITLMFLISAVQMLTFVIVGNYILEIKGMTLHYWLILFTTSCFANMLGLNISSAFNSVITIYILIPFILVPELLFSGVIVRFDKLHKSISNEEYVPIIGDVMTSRWAYEAIMVHQFKANDFQQHFFDAQKDISNASYLRDYLIPKIQNQIGNCERQHNKQTQRTDIKKELDLVHSGLTQLSARTGLQFDKLEKFESESVNLNLLREASDYLIETKKMLSIEKQKALKRNDEIYSKLLKSTGGRESFLHYKQMHFNQAVNDLVLNRNEIQKIKTTGQRYIQLKDPVYKYPESNFGRAHFYASTKRLGDFEMDTFWFNLMFIWFTTFLLYIALRLNLLRNLLDRISN